jgi:hypothetical protein
VTNLARRGFILGLALAPLAGAAEARGCWRPNGWCRRAQRRRTLGFGGGGYATPVLTAEDIEAERIIAERNARCTAQWVEYDDAPWWAFNTPEPACVRP